MVDIRDLNALHIKFIDFESWGDLYPYADPVEFLNITTHNIYRQGHILARHLGLMGLQHDLEFEYLYRPMRILYYDITRVDSEDMFYELPSRIATILGKIFRNPGEKELIIESEQFRFIQKLCSIRYLQVNLKVHLDVINERVDLNQSLSSAQGVSKRPRIRQ